MIWIRTVMHHHFAVALHLDVVAAFRTRMACIRDMPTIRDVDRKMNIVLNHSIRASSSQTKYSRILAPCLPRQIIWRIDN